MTAPSLSEAEVTAVVAGYQQATGDLRQRLADYIAALWASLGTYRAAQMREFVAEAVPVVEQAMEQMSSLTSGYLAAIDPTTSIAPVVVDAPSIQSVRGDVDPAEVYGRPFHLVWRQLGESKKLDSPPATWVDDAIESGLKRAQLIAATDVQLSKTHTSQQVMETDKRIVGYRRVLEGSKSCGLCIVASTQRYHKKQLLPIHPQCDCSVQPIRGEDDPGQLINLDRLLDVHEAIDKSFGTSSSSARAIPSEIERGKPIQYRDVLISHEHGEIGPVLSVKGRPFLGPHDI